MEVVEVIDLAAAHNAVLVPSISDAPGWQVRIRLSSAQLGIWYSNCTTETGRQKLEAFKNEVPELHSFHGAILDFRVAASELSGSEVGAFTLAKAQRAFGNVFGNEET